jgi:hypothetical protein
LVSGYSYETLIKGLLKIANMFYISCNYEINFHYSRHLDRKLITIIVKSRIDRHEYIRKDRRRIRYFQ